MEVKTKKKKVEKLKLQIVNNNNENLVAADKKNDKLKESVIQQQTLGNEKRNLAEKKSVPFMSKNEKVKSEKTKAADLQVESKNEKVKSKNEDGGNDVAVNNKTKAADSLIAIESKNEKEKNKNINASDSQISKTSISNKIKTKKESSLQLGFTAGIGSSGVNNILGSSYFTPPNSLNAAGAPPAHSPSSIQSDLSFYAGLFLKKSFSKKMSLSAGINYHYYSTKIHTGEPGDSVVYVYPANSNFTLAAAVPVPSYYRSGTTHSYTNHFHFIELPMLMNVQLNSNQKIPIIWEAGLSFSYLIHTDALQFDPVSGVYYKNNSVFNKTQVNAITGFAIGFYKNKKLIQIGPEFQYGLTNILQSYANTKQHFFYGGLKLSLVPQKK